MWLVLLSVFFSFFFFSLASLNNFPFFNCKVPYQVIAYFCECPSVKLYFHEFPLATKHLCLPLLTSEIKSHCRGEFHRVRRHFHTAVFGSFLVQHFLPAHTHFILGSWWKWKLPSSATKGGVRGLDWIQTDIWISSDFPPQSEFSTSLLILFPKENQKLCVLWLCKVSTSSVQYEFCSALIMA